MIDLVEKNRGQLQKLCKKYDIKNMYLFGSATSEEFKDSNDIDILISFKEIPYDKYFELHEELEKLFDRKVDLVTEKSLSSPFFKERVEESKQLLYAA